jgi:hypothetical protein
MPSKTTFLAGFAAGYVLGARAGRERYEQIKQMAAGFASNPKVQETAGSLQSQATGLAATAKDKVAEKVQERRSGGAAYTETDTTTYDVVEVTTTGPDASAGSNGRIGV